MKGHNQVWISGNVGGKVSNGFTKDNKPACSFSLASEDLGRGVTWIRVNAYGPLAVRCQGSLSKGRYLSIVGELMNRRGRHGELMEVRAREVVFFAETEVRDLGENDNERAEKSDQSGKEELYVWDVPADAD